MTKKKPMEIEFAPGWADDMDLTKEEYDALVDGILQLVATGEIFENAERLEDLPEDEQEAILKSINEKNTRH